MVASAIKSLVKVQVAALGIGIAQVLETAGVRSVLVRHHGRRGIDLQELTAKSERTEAFVPKEILGQIGTPVSLVVMRVPGVGLGRSVLRLRIVGLGRIVLRLRIVGPLRPIALPNHGETPLVGETQLVGETPPTREALPFRGTQAMADGAEAPQSLRLLLVKRA